MKKILNLIVAFAVLASASPVAAAFEASQWQFQKDVIVDRSAGAQSTFAYVYLDHDVASSSRNDWADIRIKNSNGDEVAYQVLNDIDVPRETSLPTILDSSVNSRGERQFILDLGRSGVIHSSIELRTDSLRYQRQVRVYSSDSLLSIDSSAWNLINSNGYIYKFTDDVTGFTGGSDRVTYPYATSQYLKVVIGAGAEGPVGVSSASITSLERKTKNVVTFTSQAAVTQNAAEKRSEYVFDLGSSGALTNKVKLNLAQQKNFNRRIIIESSNDKAAWNYAGTDYISRIDTPLFKGERLDVEYSEQRARYIRISIYNGDDAPVPLSSQATFYESPRVLLFDALGERNFTLFYGNKKAVPPQYDLSRFAQYVTFEGATRGKLGVERLNSTYSPDLPPITESNPYLLTIILVVLVLVVLGLAAAYLYKGGFMKTSGFNQNGENIE
ncbi:MAG: DUF3999 family protein [Patescibacteria group bacterium]